MKEHSGRLRRRTFKSGTISYTGADQIDCIVRNISETGACIQIESSAAIPNRFILVINKALYLCHVEWRAGRRLGVRFETP